ncbi:DNA-(apurinic or apyrimidinic site) lyase 2 [Tanacetum coccineum]
MSSSSASSSTRRYNSSIQCSCKLSVRVLTSRTLENPARRFYVCPNRYRPVGQHCGTWDWYDLELEHDWYRFELFDMYNLLNPQQRHQHQAEMRREERIQELTLLYG